MLDSFRRTSAREAEFRGEPNDTKKYFLKSNVKANAIIVGAIIIGIAIGFYFLS
ncbi:hypothetical protein [Clostridium senegalense]|uniref:hypothetical protein n=1 Tax=Clostridium senegalense TaxID=1465809 RepID=UPI000300A21A|nr:hypothetical protein [Clostridium senegalense]